jgi:hypothetical protein
MILTDKNCFCDRTVFCEDYQPDHAIVVCQVPRKRVLTTVGKTTIEAVPWQDFLEYLWQGKYTDYK